VSQKPCTEELKRKAEVRTVSESDSTRAKSMRRDIDPLDPFGGKVLWQTHRENITSLKLMFGIILFYRGVVEQILRVKWRIVPQVVLFGSRGEREN
jgi:hypothetical protein